MMHNLGSIVSSFLLMVGLVTYLLMKKMYCSYKHASFSYKYHPYHHHINVSLQLFNMQVSSVFILGVNSGFSSVFIFQHLFITVLPLHQLIQLALCSGVLHHFFYHDTVTTCTAICYTVHVQNVQNSVWINIAIIIIITMFSAVLNMTLNYVCK